LKGGCPLSWMCFYSICSTHITHSHTHSILSVRRSNFNDIHSTHANIGLAGCIQATNPLWYSKPQPVQLPTQIFTCPILRLQAHDSLVMTISYNNLSHNNDTNNGMSTSAQLWTQQSKLITHAATNWVGNVITCTQTAASGRNHLTSFKQGATNPPC